MSEQLDKVKLVKNPKGWWERMDPLENMGVSTFTLIRDAIKEGRKELAKDLLDYLFIPEAKLVHDAIYEQLWGWPSFIQKNYGEDEVYYAYYYYAFRKVLKPSSNALSGATPTVPGADTGWENATGLMDSRLRNMRIDGLLSGTPVPAAAG
jgi:hypothetical protein